MKGPSSVANIAATVVATLLVAAFAYGGTVGQLHRTVSVGAAATPSEAPEASPSLPRVQPTSPRPSPAGLFVVDEDMVDRSTRWMLMTNCPVSSTCYYAVIGTLSSGRSWSSPVQVGPFFPAYDTDAPRKIRFENSLDGFVYGYSGAYVTHDGGRNWQTLALPAVSVNSIAINGNRAWATTDPCPKATPLPGVGWGTAPCQLEVRSSTDGGRSWSDPYKLPAGFSPEAPVAFPDGVIMSSVPTGGIEMTTDAGVTWRSIKSRCTNNPFRGYATTVDGIELWEACVGEADANGLSTNKSLFVSEDGGKSWSPRDPMPIAGPPAQESLVSTRTEVAFVASWHGSMLTRDGGKTWSELAPNGVTPLVMIRFGSASWGWAIDRSGSIWVTENGGDHWETAGSFPSVFGLTWPDHWRLS
jgi:photosystem II stability/assembly factor-like uncharacterized protein